MASLSTQETDRPAVIRGRHTWPYYLHFFREPVACLTRIHREHGAVAAFDSPLSSKGRRFVAVFGPDLNRQVLGNVADFRTNGQSWRGPAESALRRLRMGLTRMNGAQHRQQRRLILPPFHKSAVDAYLPRMASVIRECIDHWPTGEIVDVWKLMRQLSIRLSTQLLFGREPFGTAFHLSEMLQKSLLMGFSPRVWLFPFNMPGSSYQRMLQISDDVEKAIVRMLARRRAQPAAGLDLLDILLKARTEGGQTPTDAELVGQATVLFMGSYENAANALTWALFLLAQHPDVMRKLVAEAGDFDEANPAGSLERLSYLDAVAKETLRILPPVPFLVRTAMTPSRLGGLEVHRGDRIVCSPYVTHHLPEIYEHPERFRPERWETIKPGPYEFLPFGAGPRMCVGHAFAMSEIKLALAMIARRWRLMLPAGTTVDTAVRITMCPSRGLPMILEPQDGRFQAGPVFGNINTKVEWRGAA